ncbi:MAG: hypothetical protein D6778_09165 [Nitrospirae bacterium]|nr:MAG: hypothetical protein D6778_09165 [Nitrospirota bacterium]
MISAPEIIGFWGPFFEVSLQNLFTVRCLFSDESFELSNLPKKFSENIVSVSLKPHISYYKEAK